MSALSGRASVMIHLLQTFAAAVKYYFARDKCSYIFSFLQSKFLFTRHGPYIFQSYIQRWQLCQHRDSYSGSFICSSPRRGSVFLGHADDPSLLRPGGSVNDKGIPRGPGLGSWGRAAGPAPRPPPGSVPGGRRPQPTAQPSLVPRLPKPTSPWVGNVEGQQCRKPTRGQTQLSSRNNSQ